MDSPKDTEGWNERTAPGLDEIAALAETVRATFPQPFRDLAAEVILRVEDFPSRAILADMGIDDPFELTGLYDGVPLTERALSDPPRQPDVVWLFRRPILEEWVERGDVSLGDLVTNVVVHEFAHHFGWSDADIAKIDPWWE